MLGKLCRQEFKVQGKAVTVLYGVLGIATALLLVLAVIGRFTAGGIFGMVSAVAECMYALTVLVVIVVSFIYLCFHFYQSMYSQQGYLTHTLPVESGQVLNVKVAVSFLYLLLTGILVILSFGAIGFVKNRIQLRDFMEMLRQAVETGSRELEMPGAALLFFILVMLVFGSLNALLMFFAGSSIGQLSHRSKGACGIAASIGLYYVSQIVSVLAVLLGYWLHANVIPGIKEGLFVMVGCSVVVFFWTVVYYTICRVIVRKHLNLE